MRVDAIYFVMVFLGGGLGAVLRFSSNLLVTLFTPRVWMSTLLVDIIGCVIFGAARRYLTVDAKALDLFLRMGLAGALTTFSTFSFELVSLLNQQKYGEFALVLSLNMISGIVIGILILR